MSNINDRVQSLEEGAKNFNASFLSILKAEFDKRIEERFSKLTQPDLHLGLTLALCVGTQDVWKQGRVKFFTPLFHKPDVDFKSLPWAYPIAAMGGIDDSGLVWVPPAGSTLGLLFEAGNRHAAYYMGTTWSRTKGQNTCDMREYEAIHAGHRKGYLLGSNEGDQLLPPWNTENYDGIDFNSTTDQETKTDGIKHVTYPNIYGFKTPQKHMLKMVDGDYECSHKAKRLEILSSCGNWFIMKDDHMRSFKPCSYLTEEECYHNKRYDPKGEDQDAPPKPDQRKKCYEETKQCENNHAHSEYFKHKNELRPWDGPGTPQNNKCVLEQTGIQMLSISGHSFYMDDSVEQPNGVMVSTKDAMTGEEFKYVGSPWERSIEKFDFGCSSKFTGKIGLVSATGHKIELNDTESDPQIRGEENYIRIISACGNKIELNDHSLNSEEKCVSGAQRGIHLQSTSNHTIDMVDEDNEQCSPPRKEGGTPIPTAKKGYVRIRSGYGLEIKLNDENSQEDTVSQSIQLYAPQKDNEKRGPHIFRMQEKPEGAGQVYLQVGGDYVCYTYDSHNIYVGDKEKNPADMLTYVSRDKYDITEEKYLNSADQHIFLSKKFIFLMAGEDCKPEDATITDGAPKKGPCVWPVLCLSNKGIVISDRIFASASEDATLASIFMLEPFTNASQEQEQPTT